MRTAFLAAAIVIVAWITPNPAFGQEAPKAQVDRTVLLTCPHECYPCLYE